MATHNMLRNRSLLSPVYKLLHSADLIYLIDTGVFASGGGGGVLFDELACVDKTCPDGTEIDHV